MRYLVGHYRLARAATGRPDLTIHHVRHSPPARQHDVTAAELLARGGHSSPTTMAIYQHREERSSRLTSSSKSAPDLTHRGTAILTAATATAARIHG